jgi:hypothetical protein
MAGKDFLPFCMLSFDSDNYFLCCIEGFLGGIDI